MRRSASTAGPRSGGELLLEDTFLQVVLGIEEECQADAAILDHLDLDDVAHLGEIGDGADRPFLRLENLKEDAGGIGQYGSTPAARPEGTDRGERQGPGAERDDGAMGGEIIGRASRGGGHHHAVADELLETDNAVDLDADLGSLTGFAEERHFVDGEALRLLAGE